MFLRRLGAISCHFVFFWEDAVGKEPFRCGFVTLIGRPNVGKSTLLNRMLGEKIAITSARPQTTRNRIPGVLTRDNAQVIFIDTPGIHRSTKPLNRYMVDVAQGAIGDCDAVALLVEAGTGPDLQVGIGDMTREILEQLRGIDKKRFLILNKIDRLPHDRLLPAMAAYGEYDFLEIVPISAMTGEGVDELVRLFIKALPEGPALYPKDALTDLPERFIAAEIVREKIFRNLDKELPYSVAVTVEQWRDRSKDGMVDIDALIHVERDSQKGIVIGRNGQMIKSIGQAARADLERLLGVQVHLTLFVRVEKAWTHNASSLRKFGYE